MEPQVRAERRSEADRRARLMENDRAAFAGPVAPPAVAVRHALVDHPLFTLEAISDLADRLPAHSVRRERGSLPLANAHHYVDVGHGRPSDSVRTVEDNGFRISLRDIHQAPEYAQLVNDCLDVVEPLVTGREGGMRRRAGYLFVSGPASTTPMHFDPEHSFLMQVKGTKHVSVAAFEGDRAALQREIDRYVDG